jgi:hypothetical protein
MLGALRITGFRSRLRARLAGKAGALQHMAAKLSFTQGIFVWLTAAFWAPHWILNDWYCRTRTHHANYQDGRIYPVDCQEWTVWVNFREYHRFNLLMWAGLVCAAIVVTSEIVKRFKDPDRVA